MKTEIKFIAKIESKDWPHFAWLVTINGETFEYKTGTGHATPKTKSDRQGYYSGMNKKPENSVSVSDKEWAHIPQIDDVLNCLFMDADCGGQSFDDFCDNYGYSNDSLKALDTYRACMESAKKLRKALGAEYETERKRIESLGL